MREIKFRAWVRSAKKMYRLSGFMKKKDSTHGYDVLSLFFGDSGFGTYDSEEVILMQFTGAKDKNGKDIYEGDILCTPHFPANGSMHYLYHEVMWDEKHTGWKVVSIGNKEGKEITAHGNPQLWVYMKYETKAEVIGNIYENPEFLDNVKEHGHEAKEFEL